MPRMMRLPSPASDYKVDWANQYTRMLEAENSALWNAIANIEVSATALEVGVTTIAAGVTTRVLYDNAGMLGEYAISGTGSVAMTTSPTFVTPVLGTPASGNLMNCTALPLGSVTGLGAGVATWLATPSSANLASAVTGETGSGALVFDTGPTLSNPIVGTQAISDNSTKAASTAYVDRQVGQVVKTFTGTVATGTTVIPIDNTIPQNTEGDQYLSLTITPRSTASTLLITVQAFVTNSAAAANAIGVALFQDSTANALAATWMLSTGSSLGGLLTYTYAMTSGTTSATTFKVRAGSSAVGTTTLNGQSGTQEYGGVMPSGIIIVELI